MIVAWRGVSDAADQDAIGWPLALQLSRSQGG
jgi:hypothetical protein